MKVYSLWTNKLDVRGTILSHAAFSAGKLWNPDAACTLWRENQATITGAWNTGMECRGYWKKYNEK